MFLTPSFSLIMYLLRCPLPRCPHCSHYALAPSDDLSPFSRQVLVWHTQTAKADLKIEKLMEQKGKPATNVGIEV